MLTRMKIGALVILGIALWGVAALYIRVFPAAFTGSVGGFVGFVTTLPVAWLSVLLTRSVGRLSQDQLLPGVGVVGALAMMMDGIALRWFPSVYGSDPAVLRLGAAWLLWGYGVSLAVAVFLAARPQAPGKDILL